MREVILVVGKTGMGKTTWTRNYINGLTRVAVAEAGFGDYGIKTVTEFQSLCAEMAKSFFRVSYSPRWWEWPWMFDACKVSAEMGGPLHFVLEEAQRAGDTRDMLEYDEAVNMGRHWGGHPGLSLIAVSTRPAKLPTDYKAQITRLIAFQQHLPNDIEYLADIIGDSAFSLPSLPPYSYLSWESSGKIETLKLSEK
jgi:hypothetical protein